MRPNALRTYDDPRAQLHQWYVEEGKTDSEIGALLGITGVAVSHKRRAYGIPTLSPDARRVRAGLPSLESATREDFERMLGEGLTPSDIATRYGVTTFPVGVKLREWGLRVSVRPEPLGDEIAPELLPAVVGTLLGDASIGYRAGNEEAEVSRVQAGRDRPRCAGCGAEMESQFVPAALVTAGKISASNR